MIKRISAIIFGLITFLTLPIIAFASDGTFTASNVHYNSFSHALSFHASSFTVGTGTTIHIAGISSCNTTGCGNTNTEFYCTDNSTTLTDPIDYSCTLNSNSNYRPNYGDTVYLEFQAGGNQLYSQAFTLSAPPPNFTASNVFYSTSSNALAFDASSFSAGTGTTIHIAGISSCNVTGCGNTNTEFYCGDDSTTLTDPIHYACTLNSNSNYRPNYGDTVYLEFQAGGNQLYSQAVALSIPPTFTASGVTYNNSTNILAFHASSFTQGTGTTIHIAGISSCNFPGCGNTNTEFYCGDDSTTLTASNVNYNTSTHLLSFHAASFSHSVGTTIHIAGISSCNIPGCGNTNTEFYCTDNSTTLTDPIDYSCTLNSASNYRPSYGDTVYIEFQTPGDQWYSQAFILDNPPVINQLSNQTINEGATYSASGSFTDTDSTSWTGTVDYGDGGGAHSLTLNSDKTFSLSHVYQDNGTYTVTVRVTDNQGATGTGTATVTVNNVTPTVGTITAPSSPVLVNTAITASANFTDPGVLDTHTASWNWGDGNTTTGTVTESNGSGSVSDSHTYTATGVYTITLTVTDKDGGVGTSTFQYVSVYDSNTSFAGGRSFDNPTTASPSTTGKVSFGISSKYNNSNVLTGSVKMNFKAD